MFLLVLVSASGVIEGKVVDAKTGEALPWVNVVVKGTSFGTATGSNGEFMIVNVPPGTYRIVASIIGYIPETKEVELLPEETVRVNFHLKQTILELGAVVVTGTRTPRFIKDVPVRTEVITFRTIEEKGARNLYESLARLPGVRVETQCQYCGFTMVRIHGLGADHTQILIDGEPVYSGLAAVYGLEQIASVGIDRIEVVKGAGSALYGSGAIAGAINIITKRPAKNEGTIGIEIGEHETNRFYLVSSIKGEKMGVSFWAENQTQGLIDETGDGETPEEVKKPDGLSDRVKTNLVNAGFRLISENLIGDDRLTLSGKTLHELRQGGRLTDDAYENPFTESTERIITHRYELLSSYKMAFSHGGKLNITFAMANHRRNATNDAFLCDYISIHGEPPPLDEMRPYIAKEKTLTWNMNYVHPLKTQRLMLGLQYSYNYLKEKGKYVVVDEEDEAYGETYTSTSKKEAREAGVYVQDEVSVSDKIEMVLGLRYDIHKSEDQFRGSGKVAPSFEPVKYNRTSINPRLALRLSITPSLSLRGSAGTGFRVPYGFSEDLHLCSGSPRVWKGDDLKPERSISLSLSIDCEKENFSGNVSFYRTFLKDKIGFVEAGEEARSLGYTYEWKNIEDAYVQGIEVGGSFVVFSSILFDVSFTLNDGKYRNPREDWSGTGYEEESRYISRLPMYTLNVSTALSYRSLKVSLDGALTGPMFIDYYENEETPRKIKRTDPYILLDGKISWRLHRNLFLYAGGKNLTGYIQPEKHTDDAAFIYAPLYGRILYAGVKVHVE